MVWSCTKGATALCAHMLASRGELALDAPVSRYWPEFAKNGKATTTVRMLLAHQAGQPGLSVGLDDRGQSLVDATYRALGYRRSERGGSWFA